MPDTPTQSEPLTLRGARYFGYHDKPRTSIRLNNQECLIVGEVPSGKRLLMHYSETYRPTGTFIKLTDRALNELIAALKGPR